MALTDNLISYWKFNGNAVDELNAYNGSVTGAIPDAGGLISGCYYFDGVNDYIDYGNMVISPNIFSFSMWVKISADPGANVYLLSQESGTTAAKASWSMAWVRIDATSGSFKFRVRTIDASDNDAATGTINLPVGEWVHLAGTFNNVSQEIHLYHNNSKFSGSTTTYSANKPNTNVRIGTRAGGTNYGFIKGYYDEMGIWDRELSSAEVSQLYNSGNGLTYPFTATDWAGKINGINYSAIAKVNGIAKASISKINGIDVTP